MNIIRYVSLGILFLSTLSFAVLDLPNNQPKVDESYWKVALDSTWQGLIRRNIQPFSNGAGLIHRPKSETPGDAVSEGVGYGMLVALYANDQETFNKMWEAANEKMWQGCYHNWQMSPSGNISGTGAATDAEEDIALSLIFADKLVSKGMWKSFSSPKLGKSYAEQAKKILDCMWETKQFRSNGILAPGADWGGYDFVNPGYFSPAWYKVFADFDKDNKERWIMAVDKAYEIISKSPGYSMGMVPDWMNPEGGFNQGNLGYNAYFGTKAFFKDAIRILWRTAIDAVWFNEERAKKFLTNALTFINSKGGASASNFYQIEKAGELLPPDDKWEEFNDEKNEDTWRYRTEHSHLTVGMWATAAMAVGESKDRIAFSEEMAKFYEGGDYFGNAVDPTGGIEDTLHNEMYFDQFLAWFGTSMMSGTFVNVIDVIDNPKELTYGDSSYLTFVDSIDTVITEPIEEPNDSLINEDVSIKYVLGELLEMNVVHSLNQIEFSFPIETSWAVFDLKGNLVIKTVGNSFVLNTNDISGMYVLKAKNKSGQFIKKISLL